MTGSSSNSISFESINAFIIAARSLELISCFVYNILSMEYIIYIKNFAKVSHNNNYRLSLKLPMKVCVMKLSHSSRFYGRQNALSGTVGGHFGVNAFAFRRHSKCFKNKILVRYNSLKKSQSVKCSGMYRGVRDWFTNQSWYVSSAVSWRCTFVKLFNEMLFSSFLNIFFVNNSI